MTDRAYPQITIRRLGEADEEAVRRLAALDSRRAPHGELLGAKVDGQLVAAISLATGEAIADPFSPTDGLRRILEMRARQMRPARERRRRRAGVRRALTEPGSSG